MILRESKVEGNKNGNEDLKKKKKGGLEKEKETRKIRKWCKKKM